MDRLKELRIDRQEKAPQPSGGSRWLLWVLAVLVVAAVAWFFLGGGEGAPEVRVATVRSVSPSAALAESSVLDASGYVTARLQATVSSKVTGKIVEVLVEEGMAIEEGQLLARLDDSIVTRQLALAEAQERAAESTLAEIQVRLEKAELDLNRSERLVEAKVSTVAQLDSARAERDALVARLASAREDLLVAGSCGGVAAPGTGRHGDPGAVFRHCGVEERPARRNDLAGFRWGWLHPHRGLHLGGHGVLGDRGGRERGLYWPSAFRHAGDRHPRSLPRLASARLP